MKNQRKKYRAKGCVTLVALMLACLGMAACGKEKDPILEVQPIVIKESEAAKTASQGKEQKGTSASFSENEASDGSEDAYESAGAAGSSYQIIEDAGETLETRVLPPAGYERASVEEGSFEEFLRQYPMKPAGSKVHLYDGSEKGIQTDHAAVFALPMEEYDLQQCADSVMRMYAEYFWATEQYDRIQFHFTSGFLAEYSKWRDGYRVTVNGNNVSWIKSKSKDTSYDCFVRYLKTIFCYAGTLSMEKESEPTLLSLLKAGDVFLYGGSPGHVVMVVDECVNAEGKKAFLLAQGYMPAQEFHLLKNDRHLDDPWYYEEEIKFPFSTPEYTFQEGSMRSLKY